MHAPPLGAAVFQETEWVLAHDKQKVPIYALL